MMPDSAVVHRLLEDFEVVGNNSSAALIAADTSEDLRRNILASFGAEFLGLTSVDGVRKRYLPEHPEPSSFTSPEIRSKLNAGLAEVRRVIGAFTSVKNKPYIPGLVLAGSALMRLNASFQSANLLIRLGYHFESAATLRLVLEQLAWAYAVYTLDDFDEAQRISPTKSVSKLKNLLPWAGRLYGRLSDFAHVVPKLSSEFVDHAEGDVRVTIVNPDAQADLAHNMLVLCDGFGTVAEFAYREHVTPAMYLVQRKDKTWRRRVRRPLSRMLRMRTSAQRAGGDA